MLIEYGVLVRRPWRLLILVAMAASGGDALQADTESASKTYNLSRARSVGDLALIKLKLEVGGTLKLPDGAADAEVPMHVVAEMEYEEKLQHVSAIQDRCTVVRHYRPASAVIKIDKDKLAPQLREERQLIVVQSDETRTSMFCPVGPLRRDELDLVDIVGSRLEWNRLLPGRPVAIGESWEHPQDVVAALVGWETVSASEVQSVLGEVRNGVAEIVMAGTVFGTVDGAASELELKARYQYHLGQRRIRRIHLAAKENRAIGEAGPGVNVVAKLSMRIDPLSDPHQLSPKALAAAGIGEGPVDIGSQALLLVYAAKEGSFRLLYDRQWYVTRDRPKLLVLRRIDHGEMVAQGSVTRLADLSPERQMDLQKFQKDVRYALGDQFREWVHAAEWVNASAHRVLQVVARGEVEKVPVEWHYFLIANECGNRLSISLTLEGKQVERFGDADRKLVDAVELLEIPANVKETASRPASDRR